MATMTATPPSSPANFSANDAKIYISTATLQLKQNLGAYVWKTSVLTPQTPEVPAQVAPAAPAPTEVQEADVYATCQKQEQQQQHQEQQIKQLQAPPPPKRIQKRWTPAKLHGEPETIYTILGNFMSAERYDSECNTLMNHRDSAAAPAVKKTEKAGKKK